MILAAGLSAALVVGQAAVPADRKASILVLALSYERDLKARAGGTVVVAVLQRSGNQASESEGKDVYAAFQALEQYSVQGLPFRVLRASYESMAQLQQLISKEHLSGIYVCPGFDKEVTAIIDTTHKQKVISFGSRLEQVEAGLMMGVFVRDNKPKIVVNLKSAKEAGLNFSSQLLRLADVIE